jgi:hypothetical protein
MTRSNNEESVMYTIDDVCWYVIVTLRDDFILRCVESFRRFYPRVQLLIVDNCGEELDVSKIVPEDDCTKVIKFSKKLINSLTHNQNVISYVFLNKHKLMGFSADDVVFIRGGFIEAAIELLNDEAEIVSLATDQDPVAYVYSKEFYDKVGFNMKLMGKERTDVDIVRRTKAAYGKFWHVGENWFRYGGTGGGDWRSKYVHHICWDQCVTKKLSERGIPDGMDNPR